MTTNQFPNMNDVASQPANPQIFLIIVIRQRPHVIGRFRTASKRHAPRKLQRYNGRQQLAGDPGLKRIYFLESLYPKMAEADELEKLISTLTWSTRVYSLAQFVQNFHLPQVVRIEVGYYGDDYTTTVGSEQVVTLHALETKEKLVGEDTAGRPIAIPLRCPLNVLVHPLPMECGYNKIVTDQMKLVYPKIKYVLSYPVAPLANDEGREEPVARFGSVLRIEEIDEEKHCVRFENVTTKRECTFAFGCSTTFEPLLDGNEYTLEEVKNIFRLPARVRFVGRDTSAGGNAGGSKPLVCSLGKVTLLHGITDTVVIASDVENRMCLKLPKDLPLQVRAAEGLIREEESYTNIVETFNRRYLGGHLTVSNEQLNIYEHLDTVTSHVSESY